MLQHLSNVTRSTAFLRSFDIIIPASKSNSDNNDGRKETGADWGE